MVLSRGIIGDKAGASPTPPLSPPPPNADRNTHKSFHGAGTPKVACPVHKKNFALDSGECLTGEDMHMLTFRAKEEGGQVYVELPPPEMLDPLLATEVNEIKAGTAEAAANGVIMNGAGVVMNGAAGHSCGGGCGGAGLDW